MEIVMDIKDFGKRLAKVRKERGYTQEKLAEALGVHWNTIAKIESGMRKPSIELLVKIAELLNISIDYLFGNEKMDITTNEKINVIDTTEFKERLEFLINNSNKSARQISMESGVSPSSLSLYLSGQREPTKEAIIKLATYFNVSTDYLLGLTDDPRPKDKNFNLLQYLSEDLRKTPQTLRNIADTLYELAEKLEKELKP